MAPLYSKNGMRHFIVSFTSGHTLCTSLRRCARMGFAKSLASAMYASTRASVTAIGQQIGYPNIKKILLFARPLFDPRIQQFHPERKGHREIDIALIDMRMMNGLQPIEEKTKSYHYQETQARQLEGRGGFEIIGV